MTNDDSTASRTSRRKPIRKPNIAASNRTVWKRKDLRERYDISAPTLWRWMKTGKIPAPDVYIAGMPHGWNQRTILAAESQSA
jgi:hypothetical protein